MAWKATADECKEYELRYEVPYPSGLDASEDIFRLYRVAYQPVTVLIARDGSVFHRHVGRLESDFPAKVAALAKT